MKKVMIGLLGLVVGFIIDIPTCEELVTRIVSEAKEIISSRLAQFA